MASLGRETTSYYNVGKKIRKTGSKGLNRGNFDGDFIRIRAFRSIGLDGGDHVPIAATGVNVRVQIVQRADQRVANAVVRAAWRPAAIDVIAGDGARTRIPSEGYRMR